MNNPFAPYEKLRARAKEIALVDSAAGLLNWDEETYMPRQALPFRAEQLAFFSGWSHRQFTAPEVGDWIKACEDHGFTADSDEAANVREWRRSYDRATKLPPELVEEFNRATTLARDAWTEARKRSEFAHFQPHLEKLLQLSRQMADKWGFTECRYDALLEGHERGARAAQIKKLFAELRPAIVAVLGPAVERSKSIPENFLEGDYTLSAQQAFNREVAEAFGFDFNAGRIDTTTHPFCTGLGPGDTRLTTRYNERDFTESFYGVLHETGHGLYDQGLKLEHHGTPLGSACSMGIHESQSRLWENHVGRSVAFWEHWHPRACHHFPALKRFSPDQIVRAINRVSPSFIRVEADQVTYDLHIILRFELELKLIEGELKAADLPGVWNEEFEKMLGLKVPNDARGCLQDIHWSIGAFGYFPTYTLGNLNAAQLMRRAEQDLPKLNAELRSGNYQDLLGWLREKVHESGQRHDPQALMRHATGETTQAQHHLQYLRHKFLIS
jgi:carboxypeptidase Taq